MTRRKIVDISMTIILVFLGAFVITYREEIWGWLIIFIAALVQYKEIAQLGYSFLDWCKKSVLGESGGQRSENSTNVAQMRDVNGNVTIIQHSEKNEQK